MATMVQMTKNIQTIGSELRAHVVAEFLPGEDPDVLNVDDELLDSGVLDSLSLLKLVAYLDEQYGVQTEASDITSENFGTLERLTRFVLIRRKQ